jgi:hypothetical protein
MNFNIFGVKLAKLTLSGYKLYSIDFQDQDIHLIPILVDREPTEMNRIIQVLGRCSNMTDRPLSYK